MKSAKDSLQGWLADLQGGLNQSPETSGIVEEVDIAGDGAEEKYHVRENGEYKHWVSLRRASSHYLNSA